MNAPFVTIQAVELPVEVTQVPDPEKLPVTFALEMEAIVIVPDVNVQRELNVAPLELCPMRRLTELHATVVVAEQLFAILTVDAT